MAAEGEISLLSKTTHQTWSPQPGAEEEEDADEEGEQHVKFLPPEGGVPSPELRGSESESSFTQEVSAETQSSGLEIPYTMPVRVSLGFETSQTSVHSTDTTLEFYDAPLSENQEREDEHKAIENDEEVVTINIKAPPENEHTEKEDLEQDDLSPNEQIPLLTSEDTGNEGQEVKEDQTFEGVGRSGLEQVAKMEEEEAAHSKKDERGVESNMPQEDGPTIGHEEESVHNQGNYLCHIS